MKAILISFALLLLLHAGTAAQNPMTFQDTIRYGTLNEALDAIFGGLDPVNYPSGILLNRGMMKPNTLLQDGSPGDSITDYVSWLNTMLCIKVAHTDTANALPDVYMLNDSSYARKKADGSIRLGFMYYEYQAFIDSAEAYNLIEVLDDHRLSDVSGRPYSPYYTDTIFSLCPMHWSTSGLSAEFVMDTSFFFRNLPLAFTAYTIDFDDGLGHRQTGAGTVHQVTWGSDGEKIIRFRAVTAAGDTLLSQASIRAFDESGSRDIDEYVIENPGRYLQEVCYYNQFDYKILHDAGDDRELICGKYAVWYACGNTSGHLKKPIIFCTGFNPGNSKTLLSYTVDSQFNPPWLISILAPKKFWRGAYYETYNGAYHSEFHPGYNDMENNGTNFLYKLRDAGYDVVIFVGDKGEDFVQNTAAIFIEVIKQINGELYTHGSDEELVVAGYSAGAYVSRYALMTAEKYYLEHRDQPDWYDYPHPRTKLWLSFEGEYYGANNPIGQQFFSTHMENSMPGALLSGMLANMVCKIANDYTNSPASKQLAAFHASAFSFEHGLRLSLMSEYNGLRPGGYPTFCRRITVSQGSGVGVTTKNPGHTTAPTLGNPQFNVQETKVGPGLVLFWPYRRISTRWQPIGYATIFDASSGIIIALGPLNTYVEYSSTSFSRSWEGWDACPGGTQALTNLTYKSLDVIPILYPTMMNIGLWGTSWFHYTMTNHSFSPTVGTFDLRNPSTGAKVNVYTNIDAVYDLYNIRKDALGTNVKEPARRFGYPHLKYPSDPYSVTPFDAVASVGTTYNYLPNQFHVDDVQPDFLDFLMLEIAPDTLYLQKRTVGEPSYPYRADFNSRYGIYSGKRVYQEFSRFWLDAEGDFIVQEDADVDMKAGDFIMLRPGFNAVPGSVFHAYIVPYDGDCTLPIPRPVVRNDRNGPFRYAEKEMKNENPDVNRVSLFPNPASENVTVEIDFEGRNGEPAYIAITSVGGTVMHNGKTTALSQTIDISHLPPGAYVVTVSCGTVHRREKLVVK